MQWRRSSSLAISAQRSRRRLPRTFAFNKLNDYPNWHLATVYRTITSSPNQAATRGRAWWRRASEMWPPACDRAVHTTSRRDMNLAACCRRPGRAPPLQVSGILRQMDDDAWATPRTRNSGRFCVKWTTHRVVSNRAIVLTVAPSIATCALPRMHPSATPRQGRRNVGPHVYRMQYRNFGTHESLCTDGGRRR